MLADIGPEAETVPPMAGPTVTTMCRDSWASAFASLSCSAA